MASLHSIQKVKGWNDFYKEKPHQKKEPDRACEFLHNYFQKQRVKKILDLGCGDGRHILHFTRLGYQVFGLDLAFWGMRRTKEQLSEACFSQFLALGDIQSLPFQENNFDAIFSIHVVHHNILQAIEETFNEVWRVLGEGGLFYTTLARYHENHRRKSSSREIETRTFVPLEGHEAGLPHHLFTLEEVFNLTRQWKMLLMETTDDDLYRVLLQKSSESSIWRPSPACML